MPVANIVVAYVNQPKGSSKKGSVKTEAGEYFGVWHDKLSQYAPGGKYTVEYDTEFYKDKEYKTIKRIVQSSAPQAASSPSSTVSRAGTQAVEMFVMGIIGKALEGTGGLPDEDTLTGWVVAARAAWTRGFAAPLGPVEIPPRSPLSQELNDEIPF